VSLVNEGFTRVDGWGKDKAFTESEILSAIDKGSATGGREGRFWTIDPVDGTSGFIRRQQFAVCLALIVDGQVELGVIGCPNIGPEPANIGEEVVPNGKGVLMVAVRGEGSWSVSTNQNVECNLDTDTLHSAPSTRRRTRASPSPLSLTPRTRSPSSRASRPATARTVSSSVSASFWT
jgi:3'(2'), 5'-bisphosphate nucleotidase